MFLCTFFGRCFEFLLGIQLAYFIKKKITKEEIGLKYTITGILWILFCLLGLALIPVVLENKEILNGVQHPIGICINNIILPIGISLFYYGLITEKNFVVKILSSNILVALGKSSYIFYLIHLGIINFYISQYVSSNQLLSFIFLNGISLVLFYLIEEPLNRLIRN